MILSSGRKQTVESNKVTKVNGRSMAEPSMNGKKKSCNSRIYSVLTVRDILWCTDYSMPSMVRRKKRGANRMVRGNTIWATQVLILGRGKASETKATESF